MPVKRADCNRKKPWAARCKRDGIEYFLGYYLTAEEARVAEQEFDAVYPRHLNQYV